MRIGAFVPQGWRLDLAGLPVESHWDTMLGVARTIESAGYESLWVYDHFHTVPSPGVHEVTYEAWTLMAALAAATDGVRLGQMCTCNEYRPPAYLAKVAASVDVISGGRLEMGIGAGWYEREFDGYGYPFERPAVRIGRLEEAVEIMRLLWTRDDVDYDGKHYRLRGAICRPHPMQEPHIPLWIAGGGEQLTLRVAARYAAYTNFGGNVPTFIRKSEILAGHCAAVGTDFDAIVRTGNFNVICEATEADAEDKLAWFEDRLRHHAHTCADIDREVRLMRTMTGTPEQLVDRLRPWVDAGLAYAICYFPDAAADTAGLERFAKEVAPSFS